MKKTKLISLFLAFFAALSCFTGCAGANKGMDTEKLSQALDEGQVFADSLVRHEKTVVLELFGLDKNDVSACVFSCSAYAGVEEYAVFEAADDEAAGRIADAVYLRLKWQKISCGDYRPEQLQKLNAAIVRQSGVYVVYVCARDAAGAERIINRYI